MALIERDREPGANELRWFGLMFVGFFGLIGGLVWYRTESLQTPIILWVGATIFAIAYYAVPAIQRSSFRAWMTITYPIGWTVSHLVLGIFYFLIFTPIGLFMRLIGHDPMRRRLDRTAPSYWIEHRATANAARYWRQF
jgi:hypothetical protein